MTISHEVIYAMVSSIPEGRVATYGQISTLLGYPRHARQIGYALSALTEEHHVPWHRVVNAKGKISPRTVPGYDEYQRILLEEEGIKFNDKDCIPLKQFQWQPDDVGIFSGDTVP